MWPSQSPPESEDILATYSPALTCQVSGAEPAERDSAER